VKKHRTSQTTLMPVERIVRTIVRLRGRNVMLASDLARIYGVETRALNQAVKRNAGRFPRDFAFRLTRDEAVRVEHSRSQTVILKRGRNVKYAPLAFTEYGAIMAANVLNSPRAVQMSISSFGRSSGFARCCTRIPRSPRSSRPWTRQMHRAHGTVGSPATDLRDEGFFMSVDAGTPW